MALSSSRTTGTKSVANSAACKQYTTANNALSCLRKAGTKNIQTAMMTLNNLGQKYIPVINGEGGILPDCSSNILSNGTFVKLPFIASDRQNEGTLFTPTAANADHLVSATLTAEFQPATQGDIALEIAIAELRGLST